MKLLNRLSLLILLVIFAVACSQAATTDETPAPETETDPSVTVTILDPTALPSVDLAATAVPEADANANANAGEETEPVVTDGEQAADSGDTAASGEATNRDTVVLDENGNTSLNGVVVANSEQWYMLSATAGQALAVDYQSENESILSIYNPDGSVLALDAAKTADCCGTLPQDGDYALIIRSGAVDVTYALDVAVAEAGAAAGEGTGEGESSAEGEGETDSAETDAGSEGEERRIEFAGVTGTIVGDTLAANAVDVWLLAAEPGQLLTLSIFPYPTKTFTVTAPSGEAVVLAEGGDQFTATISESGDYSIAVSGEFDGDYSLTVELLGEPSASEAEAESADS